MGQERTNDTTPVLFKRQEWEEHPEMFPTCDWSYCDEPTVGIRWDGAMAWLSVCEQHAQDKAEGE